MQSTASGRRQSPVSLVGEEEAAAGREGSDPGGEDVQMSYQ